MKVATTTKGLTLGLCLLAILFGQFLAACGGNTPTSTTSNGPVDLTIWTYPAVPEVGPPPANWDLYATVKKELNINLKVSLIPLGDDGDTKMSAAAAANNLPDLFQVTNVNLFQQWVNLGLIAPVNDLLPLMPQRTKARYSNPTLNKIATINGKQYRLLEPTTLTKRGGLLIRQDWLDKLGLKAPTTLDELLNVAKAFTFNDPDGDGKKDTYGLGAITTSGGLGLGGSFNAFLGAFGINGNWDTTSGKALLTLRNPGYMQAIQFLKQLQDAKVIDPDWTTLTTNDFRARWKQGKYGIIPEDFCSAICQANYQPFDANFPNGQLVPLAPPQGPNGQASMGGYATTGFSMGISQKAVNAGKGPAIAKLLEWLNSGEGYYLAGFGHQGVNYKLDAQGNMSTQGLAVPFTSHQEAPYIQIRNTVLNNSPAELKVRYPSFKTKAGRTIDPLQVYNTIASFPWQDQTRFASILPASNQADLNRYVDEALVQFVTGQKPLTTASWNAFIQGLDGLNVSTWESAATKTLQNQGLLK